MNVLKKVGIGILVFIMLTGVFVCTVMAMPQFHFEFTLVSVEEDPAHAGLLNKPTWYQWIYKVEAVEGGPGKGFSHFTIELEDCFNAALLDVIEGTAGANGNPPNSSNLLGLTGNALRTYTIVTGTDASTGLYGIKWELSGGDPFENVGDIDYFWFSAPTNVPIENEGVVKHGQNLDFTVLETPDCPECDVSVIPEPATMLLFSTGLMGLFFRRKIYSCKT